MSLWYDAFGRDLFASNVNGTAQSQSNGTAVVGEKIGDVNVTNAQLNSTEQSNTAFGGGYGYWGHGSDVDASNFNGTFQAQSNPTAIIGGEMGDINVTNVQANDTEQSNTAFGGGWGFWGHGSDLGASNFNLTTQIQANPTVIVGGEMGDINVTNVQSNSTDQDNFLFG